MRRGIWTIILAVQVSDAVQTCPVSSGGGLCPDGNTCCTILSSHPFTRNGCISNDMGSNGVCCPNFPSNGMTNTGCPPKYECKTLIDPDTQTFTPVCQHDTEIDPDNIDPLVRTVPRYKLCSPSAEMLKTVHGLPVLFGCSSTGGEESKDDCGDIAYYSSHEAILSLSSSPRSKIRAAMVVVHGQSRNADDYFCAAHLTSQLQTRYPADSVVVIAPWFLEWTDGNVTLSSGRSALRWGSGERRNSVDNAGVWRYGADAIYPSSSANRTSSFDALDAIVESLANSTQFPNLDMIAVSGHSSGGQMVQRWALLTNKIPFGDIGHPDTQVSRSLGQENRKRLHVRAIVANPSSYVYLDGRRYINNTFQYPTKKTQATCPQYNQWEYGLDVGGPTDVRYEHKAIMKAGGIDRVIERYGHRDVAYLAGSQDRCPTTGRDGWCYSHGLETTCMDMLQGSNRLERSWNYFHSLKALYGRQRHTRTVIDGVGHDHSLMFTSREGIAAIWTNVQK
mmetsp:Transcript_13386/g.29067  ORF Transcript_13386/g.29067 Transcript_13386/m.29067 type:complete len:506 (-) Transcript_13386:111-1628(-)